TATWSSAPCATTATNRAPARPSNYPGRSTRPPHRSGTSNAATRPRPHTNPPARAPHPTPPHPPPHPPAPPPHPPPTPTTPNPPPPPHRRPPHPPPPPRQRRHPLTERTTTIHPQRTGQRRNVTTIHRRPERRIHRIRHQPRRHTGLQPKPLPLERIRR